MTNAIMENRKKAHIEQAFNSKTEPSQADRRFLYEPLAGNQQPPSNHCTIAGKPLQLPIWISSMTGGTEQARQINHNLAQACAEFGMGMGLGSCRILLEEPQHLPDFDVRPIIGKGQPLFANLGICQIEQMVHAKTLHKVDDMLHRLDADGLIIHVNPLQEAFQIEGDQLQRPPLETIEAYLTTTNHRVIVKEVGQGFGPTSLKQLLQLPLEAIEFGAFGGTNFALLEINRTDPDLAELFRPFSKVGHTAEEMTRMVNAIVLEEGKNIKTKSLIISGGINNVLDGYHLTGISKMPAIFGMGSAFLQHARGEYKALQKYVQGLQKGWIMANQYLRIRK